MGFLHGCLSCLLFFFRLQERISKDAMGDKLKRIRTPKRKSEEKEEKEKEKQKKNKKKKKEKESSIRQKKKQKKEIEKQSPPSFDNVSGGGKCRAFSIAGIPFRIGVSPEFEFLDPIAFVEIIKLQV